jgi:hypothetical protein
MLQSHSAGSTRQCIYLIPFLLLTPGATFGCDQQVECLIPPIPLRVDQPVCHPHLTGLSLTQVTTDLRQRCTDGHTGTSVSAPMVAGIIALALEAK